MNLVCVLIKSYILFLVAIKYKGYCQTTKQCEWLGDNSECIESRCVCKKNYRWFQGKCSPYAKKGEKCQPKIDCYNGYDYLSLKCDDNTQECVCNDGYYDRGPDCRKISKQGGNILFMHVFDFWFWNDLNKKVVWLTMSGNSPVKWNCLDLITNLILYYKLEY